MFKTICMIFFAMPVLAQKTITLTNDSDIPGIELCVYPESDGKKFIVLQINKGQSQTISFDDSVQRFCITRNLYAPYNPLKKKEATYAIPTFSAIPLINNAAYSFTATTVHYILRKTA